MNEGHMDRGVIVGGGLIAASFLVAVLLNRSAHNEAAPSAAPRDLPRPACEQVVKVPPGVSALSDKLNEDCERSPPSPLKR